MSRIGKKLINLPEDIDYSLVGNKISLSGKMGSLSLELPPSLKIEVKNRQVAITRLADGQKNRMLHGTFRQLLANNLKGVREGWQKELEVKGTGFRVNLEGSDLVLNLGFSHPVRVTPPAGINFEVKENFLTVRGVDKAQVGLMADKIRRIYLPDAYKGKGIRYLGEQITLKPGKAAKVGVTGGAAAPAK